jgi:tetratricopeptide (TPR) repeat protein
VDGEQWAEAQEQFGYAVAVDPLNLDAVRGMAQADVAMGAVPVQSQYVSWGLAFYPHDDGMRQLAAGAPDESSSLALARALTVVGRYEEAVPYYEAACHHASEDGEYRSAVELLLTEALWNIGRMGSAWPLAEELADKRPMWIRPKLILADILLEQRDDARGVALLHEAGGLDPSLLAAQELLGRHDRYDSFLSRTLEVQGPPGEVISGAPIVLRYLLRAEPLPPPATAQTRQEGPSLAVSQVPQSLQKAKGDSVTGERVAEFCEIALPAEMDTEQGQGLGDGCPEVASVRLILSSRSRLTALFGEEGYRELDGRLSALCEAAARSTGAEGIKIYVDDDSCLAEFGLSAVDPSDAEQIVDLIREIEARLGLESRQVLSLLIVGGDAIIPFHRVANPADDEDPEVLTDWPYAARADNSLLSKFSVGRLPDPGDGQLDTLLALVDRTIAHHEINSSRESVSSSAWLSPIRRFFGALQSGHASVGYSAEIWAEASRSVFEVIGDPRKLQLSPPSTDYDFLSAYERVPTLAYFNLHGFRGSPY